MIRNLLIRYKSLIKAKGIEGIRWESIFIIFSPDSSLLHCCRLADANNTSEIFQIIVKESISESIDERMTALGKFFLQP